MYKFNIDIDEFKKKYVDFIDHVTFIVEKSNHNAVLLNILKTFSNAI